MQSSHLKERMVAIVNGVTCVVCTFLGVISIILIVLLAEVPVFSLMGGSGWAPAEN